jgi:solute carrier family 10 (sodium/bile acid cotransporter), member 7
MDEDLEKDIGSRAETPSQQSNHSDTSFQPLSEKSKKSRKSSTSNLIKQIIKLIIDQWFLISLGLVILVASQVQVPSSHQKLKSTLVSYLCVSIIFFLTGCTLKTQTLIDNYSRWKIHLFVQLQCYLLTSATIFALVSACATNPEFMDAGLLLGLLLTGCTATTISSNVIMTGEAHGNQALTVVQSTLGNFLAPFLTPLIFSMYTSTGAWYTEVLPKEKGGYGEIYRRVFKQLGLSLFVPMVSLVRIWYVPQRTDNMSSWLANWFRIFCQSSIKRSS